MSNNADLNYIYSKRFNLTQNSIEKIKASIKERYGLKVIRVSENDSGYVFMGEYGVSIGDVTYDSSIGQYKKFNYHQGAKEEISRRRDNALQKNKENSVQQELSKTSSKKRFKLTRNMIGTTITNAGLNVLISIGAVKAIDNEDITYSVERINTVANANDLILNAWANYTMRLVTDGSNDSNQEYVQKVAEDLKNNYFNKAMMAYYDYVDQVESGLPRELVVGSLKSYHDSFRNDCFSLDEALDSSFYSYATFDESPYADAVVFDETGNLVTSGSIYGECYNQDGKLLLPGSAYTVYVKAVDVPGNNYSITNLPDDTKFVSGEAYVAERHLGDFLGVNEKFSEAN